MILETMMAKYCVYSINEDIYVNLKGAHNLATHSLNIIVSSLKRILVSFLSCPPDLAATIFSNIGPSILAVYGGSMCILFLLFFSPGVL